VEGPSNGHREDQDEKKSEEKKGDEETEKTEGKASIARFKLI
jgi:hypothetical protein